MKNGAKSTPAAAWRQEGQADPHGDRYACERAALVMGSLTDDELANGAFMNYDAPLDIQGILAGTHSSPIAWMTGVKDRIRWLSRKLTGALEREDALRDELATAENACKIVVEDARTLSERLTIAEQRNAELVELLQETERQILRHQAEQPMSLRLSRNLDKARTRIKRAIKPTESGASHERHGQ